MRQTFEGSLKRCGPLVLGLALQACGSSTATGPGPSGTPPESAQVFVILEENVDFSEVTADSMPYLSSLVTRYGVARQYYANTHPSIGNYFMLTSGQIVSRDDHFASTIDADNIVRELVAAGKTWKSYAEAIPAPAFVQLNYDDGRYASRHNPLVYYTDVHDHPEQARNVVPFDRFAADLARDSLPDFTYLVPDMCHNGHECSLATSDAWLQANVGPLVGSATFQKRGVLLLLADESENDNTNGGGRIPWVVVSDRTKMGYSSTMLYQHQSTLRFILEQLGITHFPGASASAPDMGEFLQP